MTLTGVSTYVGPTTVNGGTLTIDSAGTVTSGRLANTSVITLNNGGTLLLANTGNTVSTANFDRINNAAGMTLACGILNLGGQSEGAAGTSGVGALTLTATSTLDFGTQGASNLIQFARRAPTRQAAS